MPASVAQQCAYERKPDQSHKTSFVGILRRKASSYDLGARLRSDSNLEGQDKAEKLAVNQEEFQRPLKRRQTWTSNLRQSFVGLEIPQKVKQIIGRKRSRDEDDDDDAEVEEAVPTSELPRKTKAQKISGSFWSRYQNYRKQHNGIEAMVEAATVAHTYDEQHQLDRHPPHVNEESLAFLEGRLSLCDTAGWPGGDIEAVNRFLNSANFGVRTPVFNAVPDFSWAGDEVNDFRLFVNAVEDQGWLREVV